MTTSTPLTEPIEPAGAGTALADEPGAEVAARATKWPGRPTHARRVPDETPAHGSFWDRVEARLSRLSTRNHFWRSVFSMIWLPFAFRSGLRVKRLDARTFTAILPFKRFNRNWYNAMAGGALLANSEIAGGMYVFGVCGGDYTVVCKDLAYKILRPCVGPAVYKIRPKEDLDACIKAGGEFNLPMEIDILQQISPGREKRVGRCDCVFHVTPKTHHKARKREKRAVARARRDAGSGAGAPPA